MAWQKKCFGTFIFKPKNFSKVSSGIFIEMRTASESVNFRISEFHLALDVFYLNTFVISWTVTTSEHFILLLPCEMIWLKSCIYFKNNEPSIKRQEVTT